jgi:hypothetical protein
MALASGFSTPSCKEVGEQLGRGRSHSRTRTISASTAISSALSPTGGGPHLLGESAS